MDESWFQIRRFGPEDYEAEALVRAAVDPAVTFTADEIRYWDSQASRPPFLLQKFVALEQSRRTLVGIATLGSDIESSDRRVFWVDVCVSPAHRQRGVGLALARTLESEAKRVSPRRLLAGTRADDPRGVRFLERQGFVEVRRTWRSRLELATAPRLTDRSGALGREGITYSTLSLEGATDPATHRALYDLSAAASADEPRHGPYTSPPFEQFVALEIRRPAVIPEAYFIAKHDRRFIGFSYLLRLETQPDALLQSFTGTLREYRRRGVATELKRRGVEYAREHAYRTMYVGNDSLNEPILAINRKLGFVAERERIIAERRFGDAPAT